MRLIANWGDPWDGDRQPGEWEFSIDFTVYNLTQDYAAKMTGWFCGFSVMLGIWYLQLGVGSLEES